MSLKSYKRICSLHFPCTNGRKLMEVSCRSLKRLKKSIEARHPERIPIQNGAPSSVPSHFFCVDVVSLSFPPPLATNQLAHSRKPPSASSECFKLDYFIISLQNAKINEITLLYNPLEEINSQMSSS